MIEAVIGILAMVLWVCVALRVWRWVKRKLWPEEPKPEPKPEPEPEREREPEPEPAPLEALPKMDVWLADMLYWGAKHSEPRDPPRTTSETYAWYYDGQWVYYQMADYTGDQRWLDAALVMQATYLPYVINGWGNAPGRRIFPHGLYQSWLRTRNQDCRKAIVWLGTLSAWAYAGGDPKLGWIRGNAYILQTYVLMEKLDEPRHPKFDIAVANAKGHLRKFIAGENVAFFMIALCAHALAEYEEHVGGDPEVAPLIREAAEQVWKRAWNERDGAFLYEHDGTQGKPDDSMLQAYPYAYLANRFPDEPVHRERFVKAWEGHIGRVWLAGGKQFTITHRLIFESLRLLGYPIKAVRGERDT